MKRAHTVLVVEGAVEPLSGDDGCGAGLGNGDGARAVGNGAVHVSLIVEGDVQGVGGEIGAAGFGSGALLAELHIINDLHFGDLAAIAERNIDAPSAARLSAFAGKGNAAGHAG